MAKQDTMRIEVVERSDLAPRSMMVRFGNEEHLWKVEPQCLVCQSPHRMYIENLRLRGTSYQNIADAMAEMEHGPSRAPTIESVKNHFKRQHSSVPQRAMQRLLEAEAQRVGLDEDIQDLVVTPHLITQMTLQRGYERFLKGEIDVDMHTLQNAARMQVELDKMSDHGGITAELLVAVMDRMFDIFRDHMDPDAFRKAALSTTRDPILTPLLMRAEGREGEVVQGEVEPRRDENI